VLAYLSGESHVYHCAMPQLSSPELEAAASKDKRANKPVLTQQSGKVSLRASGNKSQPTLVIEPLLPEAGLVIIFHGAGGSAHCFEDLAQEWSRQLPHIKFVMPTAPVRGGMTAWMAKKRATGECYNYEREWRKALTFIEEERRNMGVPLSRVVIMGYSAGASMASWVALNLPRPCGGLVLLSGVCASAPRLPEPRQLALGMNQTPILYMCGTDDVQIPAKVVRTHVKALLERGFAVKFKEFEGVGHELIEEELEEVLHFLTASLPAELPDASEASRDSLVGDLAHLDSKIASGRSVVQSKTPIPGIQVASGASFGGSCSSSRTLSSRSRLSERHVCSNKSRPASRGSLRANRK